MEFRDEIMLHYRSLLQYAAKLTRNREAVHDLVQDTIVKALSRQGRYVESGRLSGWLTTIMHNEFINSKRHLNRQPFLPMEDVPPTAISGSQEDTVLIKSIVRELSRLSPSKQQLISSHTLGHTYEEMAQANALPLGTVRSRLSRTHSHLRQTFS